MIYSTKINGVDPAGETSHFGGLSYMKNIRYKVPWEWNFMLDNSELSWAECFIWILSPISPLF